MGSPTHPESHGTRTTHDRVPLLPQRVVTRERLLHQLGEASASGDLPCLTLVIGPAGTGKTVLASHWVRESKAEDRVIWVNASTHPDVVPAILKAAGLPSTTSRELARETDDASRDARLVEVLQRTVERGHTPRALVIDDAQLLPRDQLRLLARLLETVSQALRLVILTRRDLVLPLVSLELDGRLKVIRARHLRFLGQESQELVLSHVRDATQDEVAFLEERTRGWAAALVLGARTLRTAEDRATALALLQSTDQPVLDYLLVEALDALPDETLRVLRDVCGEPALTAETVAVLSGSPDGVEQLKALTADGLLVTAFAANSEASESQDVVWELHPLLQEYLRRRRGSGASLDTAAVDAAIRGVRHAREIGDPEAAVRHALNCNDVEVLCGVVSEFGPELIVDGRHAVLAAALHAVPEGVLRHRSSILAIQALLARARGDVPTALRFSVEASEEYDAQVVTSGASAATDTQVAADLLTLRLWRARHGWSDVRPAIQAATDYLHVALPTDPDDHNSQAVPTGLSGTRACGLLLELSAAEAWCDESAAAERHAQEALVLARSIRSPRLTAGVLALQALYAAISSSAATASELATESLAIVEGVGHVWDVHSTRAHLALAWARFQALDFAAARDQLELTRRAAAWEYEPMTIVVGTTLRAALLLEEGRLDEALRVLSWPMPVPTPLPRFNRLTVAMTRAQVAAIVGAHADLRAEIGHLRELGSLPEAALFDAVETARQGDVAHAVQQLGSLARQPIESRLTRVAAHTLLLVTLLRAGEVDKAREALPAVLSLVAADLLLHPLTAGIEAGDAFVELLYDEVRRPDAHPFAAAALAAIRQYHRAYQVRQVPAHVGPASSRAAGPPATGGPAGRPVSAPPVAPLAPPARPATADWAPSPSPSRLGTVPLTAREMAVLQQLSLGGSYGDIAASLYITVNTVKTHVASLYRKLEVDKKVEALRKARDLGLINSPVKS